MLIPERLEILWHAAKHLHRHGRFGAQAPDITAVQILSEKYKEVSIELFGYVFVPEEAFQELSLSKWVG